MDLVLPSSLLHLERRRRPLPVGRIAKRTRKEPQRRKTAATRQHERIRQSPL